MKNLVDSLSLLWADERKPGDLVACDRGLALKSLGSYCPGPGSSCNICYAQVVSWLRFLYTCTLFCIFVENLMALSQDLEI